MINKILITKPSNPQIRPLLNSMEKDPYFKLGENYDVLKYGTILTKEELDEYKIVICDSNPKFILGVDYFKDEGNMNQIMIQLTHGVWLKKPNEYLYKENGYIDFILSPNKFTDELYREMGYSKEEILSYGYLKAEFYSSFKKEDIMKKMLGLFPMIENFNSYSLFAPSWIRMPNDEGDAVKEIEYNLDLILGNLDKGTALIIAPHPLTKMNGINILYTFNEKYKDIIFEIPGEEKLSGDKIISIADTLFTDFSSIYFEFAAIKGFDKCFFYNPIKDKNQTKTTSFIYNSLYNEWNTGSRKYIPKVDDQKMEFYNRENITRPSELLILKIKEILKNE